MINVNFFQILQNCKSSQCFKLVFLFNLYVTQFFDIFYLFVSEINKRKI
jgi:hypothetical protein